ncbi:cytochrome c oxidase subunit II transmembrane domain-containing protein [Alkalinema pantanalense CENA528]|uniref:cytochrome c oxidase subunit II n=1 Tax=Alkalinema pantanalense TaxID=1620705 RepID=UPI003D6EC21A
MKIPSQIATLLAGILLTLLSLWYGYNHHLLPIAASAEAELIDDLFNVMMTIGTGIFIMVQGALLWVIFRYRRKPGDDSDAKYIHGNIPLEIVWTAIPAMIVLALSIYSFDIYEQMGGLNPMDHGSHLASAHSETSMAPLSNAGSGAAIAAPLETLPEVSTTVTGNGTKATLPTGENPKGEDVVTPVIVPPDAVTPKDVVSPDGMAPNVVTPKEVAVPVTVPADAVKPKNPTAAPATIPAQDSVVVNVNGLQFAWLFNYEGTDISAGELHVPVGRDVRLNISAMDVLHAFWVPEFRVKQDAIPGRTVSLRFLPTRVGEYPVICAELCGAYHGVMKTKVVVESEDAFQAWLTSQQVASRPEQDPQMQQAIAFHTAHLGTTHLSEADYLVPYAKKLGVTVEHIQSIQAMQQMPDPHS